MQNLIIKTTSIFLFITLWMLIGCTLLVFVMKIDNLIVRLLLGLIVFLGSGYLTKKLIEGELEVKISNSDINFRWIKKPILSLMNLTKINFEDVSSHKMNSNVHFTILNIYSQSWTRKIIGKSIYDNKNDDFKKFDKRLKQIQSTKIILNQLSKS